MVHVESAVVKRIYNTNRAGSMVDLNTACGMGLYMHLEIGNVEFGTYYSLITEECAYSFYMKSPIKIHFSGDIVLTIPELRIINHSEPLLL